MPRVENLHAEPPKPGRIKPTSRGWLYLFRVNMLLCGLALGIYFACTIRPETFWLAGFSGFFVPPLLLIHFIFLGYWLYRKPFYAIFSGFTLFMGIRFLVATVGWHLFQTEPCGTFKILSFNAKAFGGMAPNKIRNDEENVRLIRQIVKSDAQILCIQEFYDNPKSKTYNVIDRLKINGFRYIYFSKAKTYRWGGSVGMAICSKYQILSKQTIRKKTDSNNQIIRAKIDVDGQNLVLINMHLQSIFIKEQDIAAENMKENFISAVSRIFGKMKVAFQARTKQIDLLLASTLDEDLPVIICGDMNDTPYSNAYVRLRDSFQNGFEEKGLGFGITYNGKIPLLRIDHQFANEKLKINRFKTRKDITGSDHFATEACYSFDNHN